MRRPSQVYVVLAICCLVGLFTAFNTRSWARIRLFAQSTGRHHSHSGSKSTDGNDTGEWKKLFFTAEANFTRTLVLASVKEESTIWIAEQLSDILEPNGPLSTAVYVVDDAGAELHPPENKGHEANVYLSYIIDSYESLPDIVIFMHAHRHTRHNNNLLDFDAALMIRNLSPGAIMSAGYSNLRCHWDPGCPARIHPNEQEFNDLKQEDRMIALAWPDLFPGDPLPYTLAQPCCGQFAVSGQLIRRLSKERYIALRDWLYTSDLSDYMSGRIFEYVWQYLFTASPTSCPATWACYCDLYGVCFDSGSAFDEWISISKNISSSRDNLKDWDEKAEFHREHCLPSALKGTLEDTSSESQKAVMLASIEKLEAELKRRKRVAFSAGRKQRGL